MTAYNKNVVKPLMLRCKEKRFTIDALGLNPIHEAALYRFVKRHRPNGDIYGVTYKQIRSADGIGETIARSIAQALVGRGVEITDIPEVDGCARLIDYSGVICQCSNCGAVLSDTFDAMDRPYNYCPMCGKRLKQG